MHNAVLLVSRKNWTRHSIFAIRSVVRVADGLNVCSSLGQQSVQFPTSFRNRPEGLPGRVFVVRFESDCEGWCKKICGATWLLGFKAFPFIVHRKDERWVLVVGEARFEGGLWVSVVICIQIGTLGVCSIRIRILLRRVLVSFNQIRDVYEPREFSLI